MKLIEINPESNKDIEVLYSFLAAREYSISHNEMPTFEKHKMFVQKNPYRKWFFIQYNSKIIGSIYVLKDNGIGIDIKPFDYNLIEEIISCLYSKLKPLKAIDSIRVAKYHINISLSSSLNE